MIICEQYFNDNDDEIVNVDDITSVGKLIEFDYRIQLSNTTYGYQKPDESVDECIKCIKQLARLFSYHRHSIISEYNIDTDYSIKFNIDNNITPKQVLMFSKVVVELLWKLNFTSICLFSDLYKDSLKFHLKSELEVINTLPFFNVFGMLDSYQSVLSPEERKFVIDYIIDSIPDPFEYSANKKEMYIGNTSFHKIKLASLFYKEQWSQVYGNKLMMIIPDKPDDLLKKVIDKNNVIIKTYRFNGVRDYIFKRKIYANNLILLNDDDCMCYGLVIEESIEKRY